MRQAIALNERNHRPMKEERREHNESVSKHSFTHVNDYLVYKLYNEHGPTPWKDAVFAWEGVWQEL